MRISNLFVTVVFLALAGCGNPDCKQQQPEAAAAEPGPPTGTATAADLDSVNTVKVDVSNINSDDDFDRAVSTAWSDYTKDMNSIPSASLAAAARLQPALDDLRAKDLKSYAALMDARYTYNYEKEFDLTDKVPAVKEFMAVKDSLEKDEAAVEAQAKKIKRITALRTFAMKVVALTNGYIAKDAKQQP